MARQANALSCRVLLRVMMSTALVVTPSVRPRHTARCTLARRAANSRDDLLFSAQRRGSTVAAQVSRMLELRVRLSLEAKHLGSLGNFSGIEACDDALSELAWACVAAQLPASQEREDVFAMHDDAAGIVLDCYCSQCGCSLRKAPRSLLAAAAGAAALIGEIGLAEHRLAVAIESSKSKQPSPQRLGSLVRSRLVAALCQATGRREAALGLARSLLDGTKDSLGTNAWLGNLARRTYLNALVQRAREACRSSRLDDDETALLSYDPCAPEFLDLRREGGREGDLQDDELMVVETSRRLSDMLPADECVPTLAACSLEDAVRLALGAPRGRSKRDALARVAALAYLGERRPHKALDTVRSALRRASGDDDHDTSARGSTLAAPVLRAVLREALGLGNALAARELLTALAERETFRNRNRNKKNADEEAGDDATIDVLLEACAEDGDLTGALDALAKRRRRDDHRAIARVVRAALPAVAAGGATGERAYAAARHVLNDGGPYRRELELSLVTLETARALAMGSEPKQNRNVSSSRTLAAMLEGCEAAAAAHDARETFGDTTRPAAVTEDELQCSRVAARALRTFYASETEASAYVVDAAMRVFAAEGATRLAGRLAAARPNDANAYYGALRCCALGARPEAVDSLLVTHQSCSGNALLGPWSRLAVAVALARAGEPERALEEWRDLVYRDLLDSGAARRKARSAVVAALVSHPRGAVAAVELVEGFEREEATTDKPFEVRRFDDGSRVRAALAKRLGNARNWAAATRSQRDNSATFSLKVGETTYARLASALVRSREARDAKEAVVLLTRYGVCIQNDVQSYLDEVKPRKAGSELYKALFGSTSNPPKNAEQWFDSRAERAPPPVDVRKNRRQARRVVADDEGDFADRTVPSERAYHKKWRPSQRTP